MFASGVHTKKIGVVETTTDLEVEDGISSAVNVDYDLFV